MNMFDLIVIKLETARSPEILGIHHVTALCGDPQKNVNFYSGLLGLRLVKRTVNFDDPGTYHLYYGDGAGSPGTIMTFFPWPGAAPAKLGNGQVTATLPLSFSQDASAGTLTRPSVPSV